MTTAASAIFILALCGGSFASSDARLATGKREWWRDAAIYQIYPLSLRDSDGDGRGDLKGIAEKLPYVKDTGFGAVWLSPIYSSPMADFGYDISNFTDIHEWYGTMEDFDAFVSASHDLGIKVVLDFVPNHSSDRHDWFVRSSRREPEYEDYYVWKDPKGFDEDGQPIPPNNWVSVFYGPAWTFHPERKQFYLHQFAPAQPDLNYRNPEVVREMKDVLSFWMKRGVDGFRVDAVPFLFEDASFRDEPLASSAGEDPFDFDYLAHVRTENLPETFDMVQQWRELVDAENAADGGERCLMVEAYADVRNTMNYFGTPQRPGAHFPFNFQLLDVRGESTARDVKRSIDVWLDNLPDSAHSNWLIGNHDQHRIGSKIGEDLVDGMNMLLLLLPGTSITYYGEEIGMLDNEDITYDEGADPQGCRHPREEFRKKSRDFERTPFQWNDEQNAGFSTANKTWLPVNRNADKVNLEAEMKDPYSHYNVFVDVMRARNASAVRDGGLVLEEVGRGTLALGRGTGRDDFFVALVNFSRSPDVVDLDAELLLGRPELEVHAADARSGFAKGDAVDPTAIHLPARSSLLLKSR